VLWALGDIVWFGFILCALVLIVLTVGVLGRSLIQSWRQRAGSEKARDGPEEIRPIARSRPLASRIVTASQSIPTVSSRAGPGRPGNRARFIAFDDGGQGSRGRVHSRSGPRWHGSAFVRGFRAASTLTSDD